MPQCVRAIKQRYALSGYSQIFRNCEETMVLNLPVVLCGNRNSRPVVNFGSLYGWYLMTECVIQRKKDEKDVSEHIDKPPERDIR